MISVRTIDGSSNIASIGYDSETNELRVLFTNGGVYQYDGVTQEVYDALLQAESKGAYFSKFIKNDFPGRRVEEQFDPRLAGQS